MRTTWFEDPRNTELLASQSWSECERRIQTFEEAWKLGRAPSIDDYLDDYLGATDPARKALLIELVHADMEFRLMSGEAARAEAYLARFPELAQDPGVTLDLIEAEYDLRRRPQGDVDLDEFCRRFPEHREDLRRRLLDEERSRDTFLEHARRGGHMPLPAVHGYELIEEIGRGGMGVVYKAVESSLGRHVALKFLPADVALDPELLQRFLSEARTTSALNHPHICAIHALGEHDGRPFIIMEFIEGDTLQSLIALRPGVDKAARWIGQAARALAAAHAAGVVHRDIKPENLMVRPDDYVKVLDFGLARRLPTLASSEALDKRDTDPGTLLGTVAYMSPEQARGESAASASDIFSLGIVLYQLITGRHPFQGRSTMEMLVATATTTPVPPSRLNAEIPAPLDGLTEAMLHKEPRLRPTAAEVEAALEVIVVAKARAAPSVARRYIVQRESERAVLRGALEQANAGRGSLICVAGEPGIGKTTLVEDLLESSIVTARDCLVARGQCSERLGGAEAYVPVMDALEQLVRTDGSGSVARLMNVVAPSWHALIVSTSLPESPEGSAQLSRAVSQQAMLREFRNLLVEIARRRPVVLFFDDVHWADVSTIDLIAHLGRNCSKMRILVIVAYRPTELLLGPHPFHRAKLELETAGCCNELSLRFLDSADIDRYISLVYPGHAFPVDFAALIYSRTEGNPLFVVDLLRYLRERGVIAESGGQWLLARELPDLAGEMPGSIRSMIQRKLERLSQADHQLLGAASVQGQEFESAVVAGALERDAMEVDDRLQLMDRTHGLVRAIREVEFPDRTLTIRYSFVHSLYQQALFVSLPRTRRAALATALARSMERHYGEGQLEAAATLGCLYELGRDFQPAARQFWLAAQNAARVFAHREAVVLARRGLGLLEYVPESAERTTLELSLQTALGLQLQMTEGFAAPEAKPAYCRARELCNQAPGAAALFPVLWGLWLFSKVRSELHRAQELANELEALSHRQGDPDLALQAHQALAMTAFCKGEPTIALRHTVQAAALYDPARHKTHAYLFGQDPAVICKAFGAVALWILGYPEQAKRQSDTAVAISRGLSPSSQAVALHFAAMLQQLRGDESRVLELAEASRAVAAQHGFSFWLAGADVFGGWSMAVSGAGVEGCDRLRQGLLNWMATESVTYQTYYLGLFAEVLGKVGRVHEAMRVLRDALELAERTGERLYQSELYRLRGELRQRDANRDEAERSRGAEEDFRHAMEVARAQEAKSFELRAAISLANLLSTLGRLAEGQSQLTSALKWFTEGWDTQDLRQGGTLLGQIERDLDR